MSFPEDQVAELKLLCQSVSVCEEAGLSYLLLSDLALPDGCAPTTVDALLCSQARDGYPSRLFFAVRIQSAFERNWNFDGRICDRSWHAFSWTVPGEMRLAQLLRAHLDGFRKVT